MVKTICDFLNLETPPINDLTVCTAHDMELLNHIKKDAISPEEAKRLEIDLLKTESYFVEKSNIICLTNLSLNHAAEQSAHFIHHYYVKGKTESLRHNSQDKFYYAVMREALGFFGSKVINHKRMCYKEQDFEDFLNKYQRRKLTSLRLREIKEISLFVREHKKREQEYFANNIWNHWKRVSYLSMEEFTGISHALGYILGDKLYEGVMQEIIPRSEMRELFINVFDGKGEPLKKYLYFIRRTQPVKETYLRKKDHM